MPRAGPFKPLQYDGDGQIQIGHNQRLIGSSAADVRDIPFPTGPGLEVYGFTHCDHVQRLADTIAGTLGIERPLVRDAITIAGLFHDMGRLLPWQVEDPNHNVRSAELATAYLKKRGEPDETIEMVQYLVSHHTLASDRPPEDPRLLALWDADLMEAARISPGTGDGNRVWQKARKKLVTPFARNIDFQRVQLKWCGWNL